MTRDLWGGLVLLALVALMFCPLPECVLFLLSGDEGDGEADEAASHPD